LIAVLGWPWAEMRDADDTDRVNSRGVDPE